jgi:hypothetical protein
MKPNRALALMLATLAACSSTTVIRSNVPAKVFVDGALVGQTPFQITDTKIVGSSTSIRLEAPGYDPVMLQISKNEELDVGALIGGIFLLVPFLWVMGYKGEHVVEMVPAQHATR